MPGARGASRRRRWPAVALVLAVVLAAVAAVAVVVPRVRAAEHPALPAAQSRFVSVPDSPGSSTRIRIDTSLYLPATSGPAPAVLLAHGFGQDKGDLVTEARRLQGEGYVVLAYSARGFGRSGGRIGLDSLDGEVADARALVDVLAARSDVLHRRGDPVVGVVGASYGGALALMLGATDPRIDTVVAGITWHDLGQALDPWTAGWTRGAVPERTFKAAWSARLFGTGAADSPDPCARFTAQLCSLYQSLTTGGSLTAADEALLQRSSPSSVLDGMRAPTLLLQGLQDSLFTLRQADRNARQIARAGAPVRVDWFDGGHDGGGTTGTEQTVDDWLDLVLRHPYEPIPQRFEYQVPASATSFEEQHSAYRYPGLDRRSGAAEVPLRGDAQTVVNPPGGQPTSVTSLPGIGAGTELGRAASGLLGRANPANQEARFVTAPLTAPVVLTGAAEVTVRVTPQTAGAGDVVLFAQLTAVTGSVRRPLPGGVAPIHLQLPPGGRTIRIWLPGSVWRFAPGDRIELALRTTDSQFLGSTTPAAFRLSDVGSLDLPQLAAAPSSSAVAAPGDARLWRAGALLALVVLLLAGAFVAGLVRRRRARLQEARSAAAPPLVVRGLTKRFRSGFVAVDDCSFTVERGQVVGLLGENGAGKTTTMRMALGLTRPDGGSIEAFGVPVSPGAPVLRRVGAFIEGPGFLPHLSGRRNLRLYWAATGRPRREARLDEALAVADLGGAIRRRVGGYSQGMRQRLAIAQAMLGMPDLLVLDEPANGLDPTQIVALRDVLRRYAAGGRTVIVSSHLLSEVEQTCSHVVVMSHGRIVATGSVDDVAGAAEQLVVEVDDPIAAVGALEAAGVDAVRVAAPGTVRVVPGALPTTAVVAALVGAGVGVSDLRRERRLEDAFLDLIAEPEPA